jgi:tRNA-dihydrouridine synthase A
MPEKKHDSADSRTFAGHRLCVAPMLDWTDRFFRYFLRQLSRRALLYTEMVTTGAILHGDRERYLRFDPAEHPVALQVGGSDPRELAESARIAAGYGYDEINLNIGCPSDRVQSGRFGACLMAEPGLVAECVGAMQAAASVPVTVKHRIGIDQQDSYDELAAFVATVADAGCRTFIIHARKAWLQGLSPRENREIPPLRYDAVRRLKRDFPALEIVINGGISDLGQVVQHLEAVDGTMMGRAICNNPWILADADRRIFRGSNRVASRHQVIAAISPWVEDEVARGTPMHHITRHLLGLFNGQPGARRWRRHLSEHGRRAGAGAEILLEAASLVDAARAAEDRAIRA